MILTDEPSAAPGGIVNGVHYIGFVEFQAGGGILAEDDFERYQPAVVEPLEIGFNAQYLLDFLRAISQDQVSFELKDQKSAGEMRPAGDSVADQYRYVVMPMRI